MLMMTLQAWSHELVSFFRPGKLWFRKCKCHVPHHTTAKWQSWGWESGSVSLTPLTLQPTCAFLPAPFQVICPLIRTMGQGLGGKSEALPEKDNSLPNISQGNWSRGRKGIEAHLDLRGFFLVPNKRMRSHFLKEHSVFPSLLTSPGPVPVIIGKYKVWFFWDWNQCCEECSDNKCCWLTVDGQCFWASVSCARCVKLRTALNNYSTACFLFRQNLLHFPSMGLGQVSRRDAISGPLQLHYSMTLSRREHRSENSPPPPPKHWVRVNHSHTETQAPVER